jgi:hypothetical protein
MTSSENIISIIMSMKCLEEGGKHRASLGARKKKAGFSEGAYRNDVYLAFQAKTR